MSWQSGLGLPHPQHLRTPLEGVDLVADGVNRVAAMPGKVVSNMLDASGDMVSQVTNDLQSPRMQPERPIPPGALLSPIPQGIGDIVTGAVVIVKSGVNGVVDSFQGAKAELDAFLRG